MQVKKLTDLDVSGKRVFIRADLNVPVKDGTIKDDTRVTASVPTIRHLLDRGAAIVACSHMGRPKGQVVPGLSMAPVAVRLRELLVFAGEKRAAGHDLQARLPAAAHGRAG